MRHSAPFLLHAFVIRHEARWRIGELSPACPFLVAEILCENLQVFQLPTALAYPLFYKLAQPGASTVSLQAVQSWIVQQKVMQVGQLIKLCVSIDC